MTTDVAPAISIDEAIALLEPFQETIDPCANGHVEHEPDAHLGRRLVHSMSPRGFGADWDYEAVVDYITESAARHITSRAFGHGLAVKGRDGKWIAFETRTDHERRNR